MAFKTICVDHVGIACAGTLEEAAKIYTEVLKKLKNKVLLPYLFPAAKP